MKIINPDFKIQNLENNIFTIRQIEYDNLENIIKKMLNPVEELGFTIKEFGFKENKINSFEICKTIKNKLVIKLEKGKSEIDLSLEIPKLIDGNYIIINGRKKLPLFQLFDIPIVTRGDTIKLRTNVSTIILFETKKPPYINISFLGRKIPFIDIIFAYYDREDLDNRFYLSKMNIENITIDSIYAKLIYDLKSKFDNSKLLTQDDFIREIGEMYSKFNSKSKGEGVLYALDLIPKIDIMSAEFFKTSSVVEELINAISNPLDFDDTNFINKRIRCFEYLVLSKVAKSIFDLCISNRTSRQPKFNVNSTQILSDCNVSDIIQFDFSINPIDELTKLSRTSLVGPGGFSRENVPEHLRDITSSMFGRLCPVDTPDRDNCGILQNLVPNVKLDNNLKFSEEVSNKPISIPVAMVPFLEHDDQTRLQMVSSQMRQAIPLIHFEQPLIQSGCEGLYTNYTQFTKIAKKDGEVVYNDNNYIIVVYNDKTVDLFNIEFRNTYVENIDVLNVYVKVGDKVKKGDIIAESYFCKNGNINIGRNLLTAFIPYYGKNYEDSVVISKKLVDEAMFTSVHCYDLSFTLPPNKVLETLSEIGEKYKPLPEEQEGLQAGESYAKLKSIPNSCTEHYDIFKETENLVVKKKVNITKLRIYPNTWDSNFSQFTDWIKTKMEKQRNEELILQNVINEHFSKQSAKQIISDYNLDIFSEVGKYKYKGDLINGVRIELYGTYVRNIQNGDKIGNRHGNKGVIAAIVPEEKMPTLDDGRKVDICINPLTIPSRMNIGQSFELHLAMSLNDLKDNILNMLGCDIDQNTIKNYLLEYIKIIDRTEWYSKQFKEQLPEIIDKKFIEELILIQPPFNSCSEEMISKALEYTNTKYNYRIFDPISDNYFEQSVAAGYLYFFRMVHIAESRVAGRGVGAYTRRTLQPLAGRKNKGGQRIGEMETACYIAHEGVCNLHECLTTKSDCIDLKDEYIKKIIGLNSADILDENLEIDKKPESVKLLNSYLKVIGIKKD